MQLWARNSTCNNTFGQKYFPPTSGLCLSKSKILAIKPKNWRNGPKTELVPKFLSKWRCCSNSRLVLTGDKNKSIKFSLNFCWVILDIPYIFRIHRNCYSTRFHDYFCLNGTFCANFGLFEQFTWIQTRRKKLLKILPSPCPDSHKRNLYLDENFVCHELVVYLY